MYAAPLILPKDFAKKKAKSTPKRKTGAAETGD